MCQLLKKERNEYEKLDNWSELALDEFTQCFMS